MDTEQKPVMIVGFDDSDQSYYALEWTLDHLLPPSPNSLFKLIVVHSKISPTSAIGLAGAGSADVLPAVDSDLRRIATRVVERAKELCQTKLMKDVLVEVVEGDPRSVLCEAVERHHASMLVVGSHGYGAIKRAVLRSVSEHVTHHAQCTVMIVKKPKTKQ